MGKSYQEHFEQRGSAYDKAMLRFPKARQQEFEQVIAAAQITAGMTVIDVPAGGAYLREFLPADVNYQAHEPCASFTNHGIAPPPTGAAPTGSGTPKQERAALAENDALPQGGLPLLPLPWRDGEVDAAVSLAGVHHLDDKVPLFKELKRVLKPGGRLALSDVAKNSKVAKFLDGYVGDNNSTGHEGLFLDRDTLTELEQAGFAIEQRHQNDFHWIFPDRYSMAAFCHELFDLQKSTIADTQRAIENELGVTEYPDGRVGMHWSLMTIAAVAHHD
ncbi:class I SAM-dependent methyltransferase [Pseudidiomarina sp. 1APR75-33.1]|uniref:class I SAM-dependent methyltransferase n=1 Tax=Pseudidiomarina terrestris TaxID=2820060 RepID=UPI00265633FD|nr:class I SAM-dependent methyltransferase [Pseudidiomarina sp. 1APR75-33.1]MDN7126956.1 class I SAM-dependent methyltransferase [Pseudidiomarina sp. 1APR75-33.1]